MGSLIGNGSLGRRNFIGESGARGSGLSFLGCSGGGQFSGRIRRPIRDKVASLADDPSRDVQLQVAIAALQG
jgi:hypothetical protein